MPISSSRRAMACAALCKADDPTKYLPISSSAASNRSPDLGPRCSMGLTGSEHDPPGPNRDSSRGGTSTQWRSAPRPAGRCADSPRASHCCKIKEDMIGQHVGNYEIVRLLGQGGTGTVYLA